MASYEKQTWTNDEIITAEKLNHIEEGISNIELTQGPKGEKGEKGDKGDPGQKGADAVIQKLDKIDDVSADEVGAIKIAFNQLLADLKAKGYMNSK